MLNRERNPVLKSRSTPFYKIFCITQVGLTSYRLGATTPRFIIEAFNNFNLVREPQPTWREEVLSMDWSSTASERTFNIANNWLTECQSNHHLCRPAPQVASWCPTRVIDIGDGDEMLKVVVGGVANPPAPYVTLSHCWGKSPPIRLLEGTMEAFQLGINEAELPLSFREAITVARNLGLQQFLPTTYLQIPSITGIYSFTCFRCLEP